MYFRVPLPLMVNSNPGMIFPPLCIASDEQWLWTATNLIHAALEFKSQIDTESLEQETSRSGSRLCMEQYRNVFYCYRRAGVDVDERVVTTPHLARHIIVAHNGRFAKLQVLLDDEEDDEDSKHTTPTSLALVARSKDSLFKDLKNIVSSTQIQKRNTSVNEMVGLFTAQDRRWWGRIRHHMLSMDDGGENAQNFSDIEQCLFVLCLDGADCSKLTAADEACDADKTLHMLRMIHGQGFHTGNRWFEKSLQIVLPRDGKWGLNYEHSTAEGTPLVRLAEHVVKRVLEVANELQVCANGSVDEEDECITNCARALASILTPPPEPVMYKLLHFNLGQADKILQAAFNEAQLNTANLIANTDARVYCFTGFGKNIPKQCKTSPDCFVQMALQLAYYRCHRKLVATYESASVRAFHRGRVDVIRAATREAYDWVKFMDIEEDSGKKLADEQKNGLPKIVACKNKKTALVEALNRQTHQMQLANAGYGVDNHLTALRELASIHLKSGLPEVFCDASFRKYMTFGLSTSQVPTSLPGSCMGYGAVVPNGYGCSYNIHENHIVFVVSSFRDAPYTDTGKYFLAIVKALEDMKNLLSE